jgi:molybdopterin-guanine dinucleotide biosynthesis protein A
MSLYVPEDLAPEVEKALENGRELQALMNEAGTRYLHARKRERRRKAGEK